MQSPYLSVIIPSFNRAEKLDCCLKALKSQNIAQESFEVLVVDDGSTDSTPELLKSWKSTWPKLKIFHQKNAGQGKARNLALSHAEGQIILFIGDDIYAESDFLKNHIRFHQEHPSELEACLGLTEWLNEGKTTSFMHWLTHGGPQFAYDDLKPGGEATFWYFYTSNLSLKKSLLDKERFDESFKAYGWEDIELGYRLSNLGLKLIYLPEAYALHDHIMEESSLKDRMLKIGKSAVLFQKKQKKLQVLPSGFKKILLRLASCLPVLAFLWILKTLMPFAFKKLYWTLLSKRYFLQGIRSI